MKKKLDQVIPKRMSSYGLSNKQTLDSADISGVTGSQISYKYNSHSLESIRKNQQLVSEMYVQKL